MGRLPSMVGTSRSSELTPPATGSSAAWATRSRSSSSIRESALQSDSPAESSSERRCDIDLARIARPWELTGPVHLVHTRFELHSPFEPLLNFSRSSTTSNSHLHQQSSLFRTAQPQGHASSSALGRASWRIAGSAGTWGPCPSASSCAWSSTAACAGRCSGVPSPSRYACRVQREREREYRVSPLPFRSPSLLIAPWADAPSTRPSSAAPGREPAPALARSDSARCAHRPTTADATAALRKAAQRRAAAPRRARARAQCICACHRASPVQSPPAVLRADLRGVVLLLHHGGCLRLFSSYFVHVASSNFTDRTKSGAEANSEQNYNFSHRARLVLLRAV